MIKRILGVEKCAFSFAPPVSGREAINIIHKLKLEERRSLASYDTVALLSLLSSLS